MYLVLIVKIIIINLMNSYMYCWKLVVIFQKFIVVIIKVTIAYRSNPVEANFHLPLKLFHTDISLH